MKLKNLEIADAQTNYNKSQQYIEIEEMSTKITQMFKSIEAIEYPVGTYGITPSNELINELLKMGAKLVSEYSIHDRQHLLTLALEYVFKKHSRYGKDTSTQYQYKFVIRNNTTAYFEMTAVCTSVIHKS